MMRFRKRKLWILAALLGTAGRGVAQGADTVKVLEVKPPADYKMLHYSDESSFGFSYQGNLSEDREIYVRVFMGKIEDFRAQIALIPRGQCMQLSMFQRPPVARIPGIPKLRLGRVIQYASDGPVNEQDFVLVFEEGKEVGAEKDMLKLSKDDAKEYFSHGISLHVSASPQDRARRERPQTILHPVLAAENPLPSVLTSRVNYSPPPCRIYRTVKWNPAGPPGPAVFQADVKNETTFLARTDEALSPVGELTSHICAK